MYKYVALINHILWWWSCISENQWQMALKESSLRPVKNSNRKSNQIVRKLLSAFGFTSVLVKKLHYDYVEFPVGLQLGSKTFAVASLQASHVGGVLQILGERSFVGRITRKVKSNINKTIHHAFPPTCKNHHESSTSCGHWKSFGGPTRPGRKLPAPREKQAFARVFGWKSAKIWKMRKKILQTFHHLADLDEVVLARTDVVRSHFWRIGLASLLNHLDWPTISIYSR